MPKIWDKDRLYLFLRNYVDLFTRASYSNLKIQGPVPKEGGAVIIAPNHCNTLMDALVVLQSRRGGPTVFGARADIFQNPKSAAALRFLKILPMARERDGAGLIRDSRYAFEEIDDTLANGVPFCFFPEGRHTPGYQVQPLKKGVARIALRSAALRPTVIVPAGICYSHFFKYRANCLLRYGEPLDVNAFIAARPKLTEQETSAALLEELHGRIQALVTPIKGPSAWRWLLLPLWPAAAILSLPMWLTAELICRKVADRAFHNTVRFGVKLFLSPILLIIWGLVFYLTLPWWAATALTLLNFYSYSIFYEILYSNK